MLKADNRSGFKKWLLSILLPQPIRSQCTLSLPPENRGSERVHWERMG